MARLVYYVVYLSREWKIKFNDEYFGPYATQRAAIKAAVDAAHKAGQNGKTAQVLVQGENNQFRTEWTYGNDPYPPKG